VLKLSLVPTQAGYAATLGAESISVQLDGGAPLYRRSHLGAASKVSATWTVGKTDYGTLMLFHREGVNRGADAFLIDLVLHDSDPSEYQAHFVPGSFGLRSKDGDTYTVGADLEVIQVT